MALTISTIHSPSNGVDAVCWGLKGHKESILSASVYDNVCATGDADGAVLLWRLAGGAPEHVCCVNTGGAVAVDSAWGDAVTLLLAQGDGCASLWDVEKGVRLRTASRYTVKGRCTWPVINCVAATARSSFVFGGDDGYLVTADSRTAEVVASAHVNIPLTAASTTGFSLFVGDVCGNLRWFDTRAGTKELERVSCGKAGVTSIMLDPERDRVVTYSMDGKVQMIDTQPFALSSSDRLLASTNIGENERQALLRGSWLRGRGALVLPNGSGDVVALSSNDVSGGVMRTLRECGEGSPTNISVCVGDEYVISGGESELVAYRWGNEG